MKLYSSQLGTRLFFNRQSSIVNRQSVRLLAILFLMMFLIVNLQAAELPEQQIELDLETLTLDQAISYALEHSPAIKEAEITVALSELDLKQTKWWNWFIPNLTLHQGYNPVFQESKLGMGLSFDLNKILGGGFKESKRARLKLFNSEIYLKTIKDKVIADVTKSYYDYLIAKKNIEILEEQLENSVKLQEILKIKFESASATINQLLSVNESISVNKLELLKAQAEVKLTELKLKQEIGYW